jgi:hypothetical protein
LAGGRVIAFEPSDKTEYDAAGTQLKSFNQKQEMKISSCCDEALGRAIQDKRMGRRAIGRRHPLKDIKCAGKVRWNS